SPTSRTSLTAKTGRAGSRAPAHWSAHGSPRRFQVVWRFQAAPTGDLHQGGRNRDGRDAYLQGNTDDLLEEARANAESWHRILERTYAIGDINAVRGWSGTSGRVPGYRRAVDFLGY